MYTAVKWAAAGGFLGGLVGTAVGLYLKNKAGTDDLEPADPDAEVAYTYEEAVEKAKAKIEGKVKLVPQEDKPDLNSYKPDPAARKAYHKIVEPYQTGSDVEDDREPVEETVEPDEVAVEPWPDEEDGEFMRISEDKFKFENPFHDKLVGTYFENDAVIGGWNEELEPVDEEELVRRLATLCLEPEHDGSYYFSNPDEETDYEIVVTDSSWDESREEYLRNQ